MEPFFLDFYRGKRVLVTGHTGFKGAWLCRILQSAGAEVFGFAAEPPTDPSLFELTHIERNMSSVRGDIRDFSALWAAFAEAKPQIVFHLAAQSLVREGYRRPAYTYDTNVMGTVHLLECLRQSSCCRSFVNVTTDKVYENKEWEWGYRENDPLDGYDPYSNSKSCSELVTHAYKSSFFADGRVALSTARAGNVIGGGDFAQNRIIPDCVRAAMQKEPITVRNPHSIRPYQHVLEPLFAYLMIAACQYKDSALAGYYNVGPEESDCLETGQLVSLFARFWGGAEWQVGESEGPHEAGLLKLDCSKLKRTFGWRPCWDIATAMQKTVEWYKIYELGGDVGGEMDRQIEEFTCAKQGTPIERNGDEIYAF